MKLVDPKAPGGEVRYTYNAAPYLNTGATVSSATWSCPGLTFSDTGTTSTTATAKISGGTDGQDYAIDLTITTSDGETIKGRDSAGNPLILRVRRADTPRSA
jgi:hypothetical protein